MENKILTAISFLLVIFLCFSQPSFAETVYLKSGKKIEGNIIERTNEYIKIDFDGVPLTYWLDDIERIGDEARLSSNNVDKKIELSSDNSTDKKSELIFVGDPTLTQFSYFFKLPAPDEWISNFEDVELALDKGVWKRNRRGSKVWLQIVPSRKETQGEFTELINANMRQLLNDAMCPSSSFREYPEFKPSLSYPYKAYFLYDCPKGLYAFMLFMDLPEHIIAFNLYGQCEEGKCLTPYFEDFNKVVTSFKWTSGLSKDEVNRMLKEETSGT